MPFKTLIMASERGRAARAASRCASATAEYTVRLKEPIEEQDDFVWLPYEVLERRAADRPAPDGVGDAGIRQRSSMRGAAFAQDIGAPTDWLIPQLGKRASSAA